jgi:hypothetical protein
MENVFKLVRDEKITMSKGAEMVGINLIPFREQFEDWYKMRLSGIMEPISKETINFVKALVKKHLILKPMYNEHMEDYDELLPYVFLGQLAITMEKNKELSEIKKDLIKGLKSDSVEVRNLVKLSFQL